MSYLPELRAQLIDAARGENAHRPQAASAAVSSRAADRPRRGAVRWRWLAVNLAVGLAGTALGLSAAGVFERGTPLGPETRPTPDANDGVAIPGTLKLLPLRASDPGGGLPWGVRVVRTTRGLTCVDVGRVDYATVGVLGQDGAFSDDRRFHPLSRDLYGPLGCVVTDAHGHGFVNVALQDAPASGLVGGTRPEGGCRAPVEGALPRRFHSPLSAEPKCPQADEREIYYGLLGPEAVSITWRTASGRLETTPTSGPEGGYLIVLPQKTKGCLAPALGPGRGRNRCAYAFRGDRGGPELPAGVITEVRYRDGHVCRAAQPGTRQSLFGACPPVGFVAPHVVIPTAAQLATHVSVRKLPARRYCGKEDKVKPCDASVPHGFKALPGGAREMLVQISFVSHVAIPNSGSWYETELTYPHRHGCTTGGSGGPTNSDIRAGQLVVQDMFVPYTCPGAVRGRVSYVPTVGAASAMPVPGLPGQGHAIPVARFSFRVP